LRKIPLLRLGVNWRGDGRRVVALTAVAMSERNEAEQHETGQQPKPPILTKEKKEKTQK